MYPTSRSNKTKYILYVDAEQEDFVTWALSWQAVYNVYVHTRDYSL